MTTIRDQVEQKLIEIYGEQAAMKAMQDPNLMDLLNQARLTNMPVTNLAEQLGQRNELTRLSEQNLDDPQSLQRQINAGSEAAVQYEARTNAINDRGDIQRQANQEQDKFVEQREREENTYKSPSPLKTKPIHGG